MLLALCCKDILFLKNEANSGQFSLFWRKVKYVAKYAFFVQFFWPQIFTCTIFYAFSISDNDLGSCHNGVDNNITMVVADSKALGGTVLVTTPTSTDFTSSQFSPKIFMSSNPITSNMTTKTN